MYRRKLGETLQCPNECHLFRQFLMSRFAEECLDFYIQLLQFSNLEDQFQLKKAGWKIWLNYVDDEAPFCSNTVTGHHRELIKVQLMQNAIDNDLFKTLQALTGDALAHFIADWEEEKSKQDTQYELQNNKNYNNNNSNINSNGNSNSNSNSNTTKNSQNSRLNGLHKPRLSPDLSKQRYLALYDSDYKRSKSCRAYRSRSTKLPQRPMDEASRTNSQKAPTKEDSEYELNRTMTFSREGSLSSGEASFASTHSVLTSSPSIETNTDVYSSENSHTAMAVPPHRTIGSLKDSGDDVFHIESSNGTSSVTVHYDQED